MIVLDTNILSELIRQQPAGEVVNWLKHGTDGTTLVTSVVTIYEIEYGIRRLPDGARRRTLEERFARFTSPHSEFTILPFDEQASRLAAILRTHREAKGLNAQTADMMIAAITSCAEASLATRNAKDFTETGIEIINPWDQVN